MTSRKARPLLERVKVPVTKDEEDVESKRYAEAHAGTSYYDGWYYGPWRSTHTSDCPQDLVSAFRLVQEGKGTFKFRCKGGALHRIVIQPSGSVSFPDHVGEASAVLSLIAGETHLPSCDDIRSALNESWAERVKRHEAYRADNRYRGSRDLAQDGLTRLWGDVLSAAPGWAQVLEHFKSQVAEPRGQARAERERQTPASRFADLAAATMLSDRAWRTALGNPVQVKWTDPRFIAPGSVVNEEYISTGRQQVRALVAHLAWPDGWEAYQYCRNRAAHGDHVDVVPSVRALRDSPELFPRINRLVAMIGCPTEGSRPSLLIRDGAGWRVSE